ncbi:MAG: recombinase family protein [Planctomycetes bacterium]|nr:recombinase family protein [Planctomycetota bacterium]
MKVALYARVATQDPDEQKGIVSQIEALRAHASKQRHEVAEDYVCCDAGYSGVSLDRPGLIQLRHGVQAKAFDAVLILSPDRLSRNCADLVRILEEFKRSAMHIMFVEQGLKMPLLSRGVAAIS